MMKYYFRMCVVLLERQYLRIERWMLLRRLSRLERAVKKMGVEREAGRIV